MIMVYHSFSYFIVESIELFNQIYPHIFQLPKDFVDNNQCTINNTNDLDKLKDKTWTSLSFHSLHSETPIELLVDGLSCIHYIYICENSYLRLSSLSICNLPNLCFFFVERESQAFFQSLTFKGKYEMRIMIRSS